MAIQPLDWVVVLVGVADYELEREINTALAQVEDDYDDLQISVTRRSMDSVVVLHFTNREDLDETD